MVTCLICGKQFKALAPHIAKKHGMKADEYKLEFGLPITVGLTSEETKEKMRIVANERIEQGTFGGDENRLKANRTKKRSPRRGTPSKVASANNIKKRDLQKVRDGIKKAISKGTHYSTRVNFVEEVRGKADNTIIEMNCVDCGEIVSRRKSQYGKKRKPVCVGCQRKRSDKQKKAKMEGAKKAAV